ncbi:MAG: radical SAM protein [Spirochaetales bacterium]|nr:radical SAM protein [Spirochaetales bacterium]
MVNAGKPLENELQTDEIKKAIDDMVELGVKYFAVAGGEPLLRKDIFEVLSYAKRKGLRISLSTNCSLIHLHKAEIENLKLDAIMVSLDGLKNNHQRIRGENNNFEEVIESIKFFKKIKIKKIAVSTIVYKSNLEELEEIRDVIFPLGCNHWYINLPRPEGRAKTKEWLFPNPIQIINLFKFIEENRNKYKIDICSEAGYLGKWNNILRNNSFFCSCGLISCAIMANGDIMACPIFDENPYKEGTLRDKSFKEIWTAGMKKFQSIPLSSDCKTCIHNPNCLGGCKVMQALKAPCLKEAWENNFQG